MAELKTVVKLGEYGAAIGTGIGAAYGLWTYLIKPALDKRKSGGIPSVEPGNTDTSPSSPGSSGSADAGTSSTGPAPSPSGPGDVGTVQPPSGIPAAQPQVPSMTQVEVHPDLPPVKAVVLPSTDVATAIAAGHVPQGSIVIEHPVTGQAISVPTETATSLFTNLFSNAVSEGAVPAKSSPTSAASVAARYVSDTLATQQSLFNGGRIAPVKFLPAVPGVIGAGTLSGGNSSTPGLVNVSVLRANGQLPNNLTAEQILGLPQSEGFSPYQ